MNGSAPMICEACSAPVGRDGERAPDCAPFAALCADCAADHYEAALEALKGKRNWRICQPMAPERRAKYGRAKG